MGDYTSLLKDLVKEKMMDKKKRRDMEYFLSEYGMEDCTELLEELEEEMEQDEEEEELNVVSGAVMTAEKKLNLEGSSEVRKVGATSAKTGTGAPVVQRWNLLSMRVKYLRQGSPNSGLVPRMLIPRLIRMILAQWE